MTRKSTAPRHSGADRLGGAAAGALLALLALAGCADPLFGPASRAQGRQCNQLVVPEQREACFRDLNGSRPVTVPRDLERPRPAPSDAPAVRQDDAAARAARRGAAEAPNPAASAP
jgi:hypothetical protein